MIGSVTLDLVLGIFGRCVMYVAVPDQLAIMYRGDPATDPARFRVPANVLADPERSPHSTPARRSDGVLVGPPGEFRPDAGNPVGAHRGCAVSPAVADVGEHRGYPLVRELCAVCGNAGAGGLALRRDAADAPQHDPDEVRRILSTNRRRVGDGRKQQRAPPAVEAAGGALVAVDGRAGKSGTPDSEGALMYSPSWIGIFSHLDPLLQSITAGLQCL